MENNTLPIDNYAFAFCRGLNAQSALIFSKKVLKGPPVKKKSKWKVSALMDDLRKKNR